MHVSHKWHVLVLLLQPLFDVADGKGMSYRGNSQAHNLAALLMQPLDRFVATVDVERVLVDHGLYHHGVPFSHLHVTDLNRSGLPSWNCARSEVQPSEAGLILHRILRQRSTVRRRRRPSRARNLHARNSSLLSRHVPRSKRQHRSTHKPQRHLVLPPFRRLPSNPTSTPTSVHSQPPLQQSFNPVQHRLLFPFPPSTCVTLPHSTQTASPTQPERRPQLIA
mmetsp:Transcript_9987/g.30497  ORF Transcript_9987/g.30497 Transcript_9987/m.30497 type:complete len:222 (-) Transcript_9987:12-677(-)